MIVVLVMSLSLQIDAKVPREQLVDLLRQANDTFRQANAEKDDFERDRLYSEAILKYKKIIDQGNVKNAKLYYNLANAYLLKQDVGRAILNYKRAMKLDSSNHNIRKNLAFARGRRLDKIEIEPERKVLQMLFFWHYDFSVKTRFILACIFFAGLCVTATVWLWKGKRNTSFMMISICAGVTIILVISVATTHFKKMNKTEGVITAQSVIARQGDSDAYPPSFKEPLHAGTEFELLEKRPGWLHIKLANENDTWIPQNSAELL